MTLTLSIEKNGIQWRQKTNPVALRFSTGQNGSAALSASWRMGIDEATLFHDTWSMAKATVSNGAEVVWTGRVEDIGVVANGVNITAFGYARAYADLLYTAVWSKDTVVDFRPVLRSEISSANPDRAQFDTNNRIYIAEKKDHTTGNSQRLTMVYELPDRGVRGVSTVSFDYTIVGVGTGGGAREYRLRAAGLDTSWTAVTTADYLAPDNTPVSGTANLTMGAGVQKVMFSYGFNGASATPYTGETGDEAYAVITNIRIKSTTAATVLGSAIAADLAAYVATENPSQGDGLAYGIQATNQDLREMVFEDERPDKILEDICNRHDFRWRVWEQSLILEPEATSGVSHYADVTSMEFQRSFAEVYTQAYATYNTKSNATLRTTTATNTNATFLFNDVKKVETTGADTTDLATAEAQRNAVLVAKGNLAPRIDIRITTLLTADGRAVPLWRVRAGDSIFVRAIPVDSRPILERRVLRVSRTDYNALTNELTVESDIPYPSLVTIVAKQGKTK